jgi:uncharacterized protein (DUF1499 family)
VVCGLHAAFRGHRTRDFEAWALESRREKIIVPWNFRFLISIPTAERSVLNLAGKRPTDLGAKNGKLKPVPATPNAVSSQASPSDAMHYVTPLAYSGNRAAAMQRFKEAIADSPGATIVTSSAEYLYAEFRSGFFGFVDDFELYLGANEPGVALVRSASRIGKADFGVNRISVEALRCLL